MLEGLLSGDNALVLATMVRHLPPQRRRPALTHVAYALVGWIGLKLLLLAGHTFVRRYPQTVQVSETSPWIFWMGLGAIIGLGALLALNSKGTPPMPPASAVG